jgi:transcriptional regulator with XRE-family HTH domain
MPRPKPLGQLATIRKQLKLTQSGMATLLSRTQAAVSKWEAPDADIDPLVLKFLALYMKEKRPTRTRKAAKRKQVKAVLQGETTTDEQATPTASA